LPTLLIERNPPVLIESRFRRVYCLVVALGLLTGWAVLATAADAQQPARHPATSPEPNDRDQLFSTRHASFNQIAAKGGVDLVFVGDSITWHWEDFGKETWKKYYEPRKAANFGIGWECTENVLWRIEHGNFDGPAFSPKVIVYMIGTNNTQRGYTPAEIADGIAAIVKETTKRLPKTKILVLAILPRGEKADDPLRANNQKVNEQIAKLADNERVFFLDIASAFLNPDGGISKEIMFDYLHPGPKGYEKWAEAMEPTLKKLLDEKN
jgi:hypothetical protein